MHITSCPPRVYVYQTRRFFWSNYDQENTCILSNISKIDNLSLNFCIVRNVFSPFLSDTHSRASSFKMEICLCLEEPGSCALDYVHKVLFAWLFMIPMSDSNFQWLLLFSRLGFELLLGVVIEVVVSRYSLI